MEKIVIGPQDALAVIDAQNDFVNPMGKLYVAGVSGEPDNRAIIARIRVLNEKPFGFRFSTRDMHPAGHVEFAIFGEHCLQDSEGARYPFSLLDVLQVFNGELIKGGNEAIISYSVVTSKGFGEHIARLRDEGIKRVHLTGWAYTHCVGESAIAYACQGFETFVIRDLTRSVPPPYGDPEKMRQKLELYGVKEIKMADVYLAA